MKFLTSAWGLAILALILNVATTLALLLPAIAALQDPPIEVAEKTGMPPRVWSFKTQAIDELVTELKSERDKLEEDQKSLLALQSQITAERTDLNKVRAEIEEMRGEIEQRVVEIEEREVKNLKTLSQTYSAMNPSAAVVIFREMDENMVVKILSLMKADRVGPLLGEMAKAPDSTSGESMAKRAAHISDKLRLLKSAPPPKANS